MAVWRLVVVTAVLAVASSSPQYGAPPVSSGSQSYGAPVQNTATGQSFSSAGGFSQNSGGSFSQGSSAGFSQNNGGGFSQNGVSGFGGTGGGRFVSSNVGSSSAGSFDGQGMPYTFDWAVREPDYGNDFDHQEESDGVVTSGQYRVNLPDGRVQIVTYTVEGDSGFQATVTYEGEAQYPPAGSNQGNGGNFNQGSGGNFNQGNRGSFNQGNGGSFSQDNVGGFSQIASSGFGQQSGSYSQQGGSSFQSQASQGGGRVTSRPSTSYGVF